MVLTKSAAQTLEFEARKPTSPQLLGAIPLAVMGVLFLLAPPPHTALQLATAGALLGGACTLFFRALPRARPARLDLERLRLRLPDGRELDCTSARALVLTGAPPLTSVQAQHAYRVELELGSGERVLLLEHADPARVMIDLQTLRAELDLPVRAGWGLPDDAAPWAAPEGKPPELPGLPAPLRLVPFPAGRPAGLTVLIGAIGIGVIMLLMYLARGERGASTAVLSIVLSVATLAALCAIAAVLLTDELRLSSEGRSLVLERRTLGVTRCRRALPAGSVRGAWAVGPATGEAHHVLIRTSSELFAVPCAGSDAERLAAALTGRS